MSIWDHLASLRCVWQAVTFTRQPLCAGWQMAVVASTVSVLWLFRGEFCYNLSDLLFIEDQLAEWSHLCCRVTRRTKKVLLDGFTTSSSSRCDLYLKFKTLRHVCVLVSAAGFSEGKKTSEQQSSFFSKTKCSFSLGFSIVGLFLGVECTNDGNHPGGAI